MTKFLVSNDYIKSDNDEFRMYVTTGDMELFYHNSYFRNFDSVKVFKELDLESYLVTLYVGDISIGYVELSFDKFENNDVLEKFFKDNNIQITQVE